MPAITEQDVLSALKSCYDPEIPVNIVDLWTDLQSGFRFCARTRIPSNRSKTLPSK